MTRELASSQSKLPLGGALRQTLIQVEPGEKAPSTGQTRNIPYSDIWVAMAMLPAYLLPNDDLREAASRQVRRAMELKDCDTTEGISNEFVNLAFALLSFQQAVKEQNKTTV